jgi:hypothetical protein
MLTWSPTVHACRVLINAFKLPDVLHLLQTKLYAAVGDSMAAFTNSTAGTLPRLLNLPNLRDLPTTLMLNHLTCLCPWRLTP